MREDVRRDASKMGRRSFGAALIEAMTARGVSTADLSRKTGLQDDGISKVRRGLRNPTMSTVAILADALDWPDLLRVSEIERRKRCIVCRRRYVSLAKYPSRTKYCSQKCQVTDHQRRKTGRSHDITAARLRDTQAAIVAMCVSCEAERICRTSDCPLRAFSPFPFIERRVA